MAPLPCPLSPAELSYLRTSLSSTPPIRADARTPRSFRPLVAETDLLPSTHGSSRLVWADGGECIVGIKAEVEKSDPRDTASETGSERHEREGGNEKWVEISVDVGGRSDLGGGGGGGGGGGREDEALGTFLACMVAEGIDAGLLRRLRIGDGRRWHWRLYVDILLLTPPISHPATLLSLATHLALRTTRLPRLTSEPDEDPLFDDDWDASVPLYPASSSASRAPKFSAPSSSLPAAATPTVTLLVAAIGPNVFFDPTREELAVADFVLCVCVTSALEVVGLRTLEAGVVAEGGVGRRVVKRVVAEVREVAREVFAALEEIVTSA